MRKRSLKAVICTKGPLVIKAQTRLGDVLPVVKIFESEGQKIIDARLV